MTHDSFESSIEDKKRIHSQHRRASEAMVRLIVLREADDHRTPNLDPASHEGWLRSEVFRLQYEALQADPNGEYAEPRENTLAETMAHSNLVDMAQPGRPLTRERLEHIDPSLVEVADRMEQEGIGWPEDDAVFHDVLPEDFDDFAFGKHLVENRAHYNNYPAIVASSPSRPDEGETLIDFMLRTSMYQYATKPYLLRAHELQPDFMDQFQRIMAEKYSMDQWSGAIQRAVSDEHPDPEDQILLRASRLAYQLLINLMRKDDLQTQARIMTLSLQHDITDPITELYT